MEFKSQKKRKLPLILLLDISGSMSNCIGILNRAVKEMIEELKEQESLRAEITLSIITFGSTARIHQDTAPIGSVQVEEFKASGLTPLGGALELAKGIIEDREKITSDSYRPLVVMMSDGLPTDEYEAPLKDFIENGRSKKCERLALGIGDGYDENVLRKFSSTGKTHEAKEARNIIEFFKFVTMTVKEKSISSNPNKSIDDNIFKSLLFREEAGTGKSIIKDR